MSFQRRGTALILGKFVNRVNAAAEMTRREIYGVLEESKVGKGRIYTHYFYTDKQGRLRRGAERDEPHQASAEGDPPARDTGKLQESIAVLSRATRNDLTAEVGPRAEAFEDAYYPRFLEFGTRKIKPRPFMQPGIERAKKADF